MRDYQELLRRYLAEERKVSESLSVEDINEVMRVLEEAKPYLNDIDIECGKELA